MLELAEQQGLRRGEIERLRSVHGLNALPTPPLPGVFTLFLRQFLSPFIYMLLIAAVISFALSEYSSVIFIVVVLVLNAVIGTIQEYSAQRSAAALRNMVRGTAHVVRDGVAQTIDVEELLPGDFVLLSSGDRVPADIELVVSQNLAVDESMLTGESLAVTKNADAKVQKGAQLADQFNRCFAGSIVTRGRGQGIVTEIGLKTQIGRIAKHVTRERVSEPPLMIRIRQFTYQVATIIMVGIVVLLALMLLRGGYELEAMLLMAIGLAVSAIPEGLPAALTVALAIGMQRMVRHNVIIRKLVAVEALGSCTFICSDKTGTLTVNELTIRQAVLPDGKVFEISGEGVAPGGEVVSSDDKDHLRELCVTGVLANESRLDYSGGEWVSDGDIVDVAFLVLAKKLGLSLSELYNDNQQKDSIPYESENAFSASLNQQESGHCLYVKGSPEKMLEFSTHIWAEQGRIPIDKAAIVSQFEKLAEQGDRIIALAKKDADHTDAETQLDAMTFLGMVAMIDPLRPEARDAVQRCRAGGIEVAMVTGDHPATAKAIAVELGLCEEDSSVVTGGMLHEANAKGKTAARDLIQPARVFARIEPQQKEQIVEVFREAGHFVAVTGDGVNDAPAMRAANAGVAMGKRGTDVAKETADLIITDDNFSSIVNGIEQGRIVYNNIRKVIALLVSTALSALLLFFFAVLAGLPMPMLAVQLLWLNLVAYGLQDVSLAFEPREGGELKQKPRNPQEPIFEINIVRHVVLTGCTMGILAFLAFWYFNAQGYGVDQARNLTLMLMVLFGNMHTLNSRSETKSVFQMPLFSNPFLIAAVPFAQLLHISAMYLPGISDVLVLQPISFGQWVMLLGIASILLIVEEVHKFWLRRRSDGH